MRAMLQPIDDNYIMHQAERQVRVRNVITATINDPFFFNLVQETLFRALLVRKIITISVTQLAEVLISRLVKPTRTLVIHDSSHHTSITILFGTHTSQQCCSS